MNDQELSLKINEIIDLICKYKSESSSSDFEELCEDAAELLENAITHYLEEKEGK
jgi:hypothetical protein